MTWEEGIAVIVSVLAVWLTTRRSLWNFPFALASVALYAHIFYAVRLYADMLLQIVFAATLMYGLWEWRASRATDGAVPVARATPADWLLGTMGGIGAATLLGWVLAAQTDAALPWLDAGLAAGSLVGTWWAARRLIENWWLWIGVDAAYVGLYAYKGLGLTAALYAAFAGLAVVGLRRWRHAHARQGPGPASGACA